MTTDRIRVILIAFKQDAITLDEAVKMIHDLRFSPSEKEAGEVQINISDPFPREARSFIDEVPDA